MPKSSRTRTAKAPHAPAEPRCRTCPPGPDGLPPLKKSCQGCAARRKGKTVISQAAGPAAGSSTSSAIQSGPIVVDTRPTVASSSGNDRLVADAGNGDHAADQDYTHKVDRAVLGQSGSNPKSGSQNSEDSDKYEWEVESSDDDDSFVWHVESDYDSDAGETARRLRSLASAVEDTPEIDKIAGLYKKRQWGKLNRKQQREIVDSDAKMHRAFEKADIEPLKGAALQKKSFDFLFQIKHMLAMYTEQTGNYVYFAHARAGEPSSAKDDITTYATAPFHSTEESKLSELEQGMSEMWRDAIQNVRMEAQQEKADLVRQINESKERAERERQRAERERRGAEQERQRAERNRHEWETERTRWEQARQQTESAKRRVLVAEQRLRELESRTATEGQAQAGAVQSTE